MLALIRKRKVSVCVATLFQLWYSQSVLALYHMEIVQSCTLSFLYNIKIKLAWSTWLYIVIDNDNQINIHQFLTTHHSSVILIKRPSLKNNFITRFAMVLAMRVLLLLFMSYNVDGFSAIGKFRGMNKFKGVKAVSWHFWCINHAYCLPISVSTY